MVAGALIALVAYNSDVVKVWIVVVIIGREFSHQRPASIASSEGFTIQASDLGKLKTVVQIVCVVSAILAHGWYQWKFGVLIVPVKWIAVAAIYFTVLVSSISAIDYFVGFWKQIDHASNDRRKHSCSPGARKSARHNGWSTSRAMCDNRRKTEFPMRPSRLLFWAPLYRFWLLHWLGPRRHLRPRPLPRFRWCWPAARWWM